VAVALVGLQQGSELDLYAYFTVRQFGMRRYASIYGVFITISLTALAVGIAGFGGIFDRFQSYDLALLGSVFAFVVAAICFFGIGKAREEIDE
jgi:hypothetical protein